MMQQAGGDAEPVPSFDTAPRIPESPPHNPFRAGVAFGTAVTIAVGLLIVQNGESAQLDWLVFHFRRATVDHVDVDVGRRRRGVAAAQDGVETR